MTVRSRIYATDPSPRGYPYTVERWRDGAWRPISHFSGVDIKVVARHALAFGGRVRVILKGAVILEFCDGLPVAKEGAAA